MSLPIFTPAVAKKCAVILVAVEYLRVRLKQVQDLWLGVWKNTLLNPSKQFPSNVSLYFFSAHALA